MLSIIIPLECKFCEDRNLFFFFSWWILNIWNRVWWLINRVIYLLDEWNPWEESTSCLSQHELFPPSLVTESRFLCGHITTWNYVCNFSCSYFWSMECKLLFIWSMECKLLLNVNWMFTECKMFCGTWRPHKENYPIQKWPFIVFMPFFLLIYN